MGKKHAPEVVSARQTKVKRKGLPQKSELSLQSPARGGDPFLPTKTDPCEKPPTGGFFAGNDKARRMCAADPFCIQE